MPGIRIEDFPDALYERLRAQAARNGRSVSDEAVHLVSEMLAAEPDPAERVDTDVHAANARIAHNLGS